MKKFILATLLALGSTTSLAHAYEIHGMYVTLESCKWGKVGYDYGYIGTYKAYDGQRFQVFFGSEYCEY